MIPHSSPTPELVELLEAFCLGNLDPNQAARLEELARSDAESRIHYVLFTHMHAVIERREACNWHPVTEPFERSRVDAAALEGVPGASWLGTAYHGTVGFFSQEVPFACLIAAVIVGVGLVIGAHLHVSQPEQLARHSPQPTASAHHDPVSELVGRITGMVDCKWSEDGRAPYGYDNVLIGRQFKLESGLMEISYHSGAKVILQGPCTYEVNSARGGLLSLGKLTAKVEEGSRSKVQGSRPENHKSEIINHKSPSPLAPNPSPLFTVKTPTAVVTDLGTEFGVNVSEAGVTETHVFTGKVKVEGRGKSGGLPEQILLAGQVVLVDPRVGIATPIEQNAEHFVRKMPLPKAATVRKLIDQIDYSDTFSVNSPTRAGSYLVLRELMASAPEALRLEDCSGNPLRSWDVPGGTAITTWPQDERWPGFRVEGSRWGLLEASGDCRCGFEYGVRDDFVTQFDAVQTADRVTITIGESIHFTDESPTLSLFFRAAGGPSPEIGVYDPRGGEVDSGLRSGIARPHQWHNYAVRFNLPARQVTVWVDREPRGTIDLDTLVDGDGRAVLAGLTWTGRYLSMGGLSPDDDKQRVWFDNFRVGSSREVETSIEQRETVTSQNQED